MTDPARDQGPKAEPPAPASPQAPPPQLAEELARMKEEPLLPAEKQLVAYSLILGVVLLTLLAWISHTFFGA